MDEVPVTRLRPTDRIPARATTITVILLGIAILKPWGTPPVAAPPPARPAPAVDDRVPPDPGVERPGLADSIVGHCLDPSGWRVFAHERFGRKTIRSWKSVTPVAQAVGPSDPAIPTVLVATARLPGLGYCAPDRDGERPPADATLTVWRLNPGGAPWQVPARRLLPIRPNVLGGLYAPSRRGTGSWATGRFAFAVRGTGYERWWAVEVVVDAVDDPPGVAPVSVSPAP